MNIEDAPRADKYHLGIAVMSDGAKWLMIAMTNVEGEILAQGVWPKKDWEKIKKEIDGKFMEMAIDEATNSQSSGK